MSTTLASVFYFSVAFIGYYLFGENILPSILDSLPASPLVNTVKGLMAIVMICSYPCVYNAVRDSIVEIVDFFTESKDNLPLIDENSSLINSNNDSKDVVVNVNEKSKHANIGGNYSNKLNILAAICTVGSSLTLALVSKNISSILDLTGNLLGGPVLFIVPSMCLLKSREKKTIYDRFESVIAILIGLVLSIVGTYTTIREEFLK
ncbi:hypothetical protein RCL1_002568 [Eukaryota sp. TZLM3-RCL]